MLAVWVTGIQAAVRSGGQHSESGPLRRGLWKFKLKFNFGGFATMLRHGNSKSLGLASKLEDHCQVVRWATVTARDWERLTRLGLNRRGPATCATGLVSVCSVITISICDKPRPVRRPSHDVVRPLGCCRTGVQVGLESCPRLRVNP